MPCELLCALGLRDGRSSVFLRASDLHEVNVRSGQNSTLRGKGVDETPDWMCTAAFTPWETPVTPFHSMGKCPVAVESISLIMLPAELSHMYRSQCMLSDGSSDVSVYRTLPSTYSASIL